MNTSMLTSVQQSMLKRMARHHKTFPANASGWRLLFNLYLIKKVKQGTRLAITVKGRDVARVLPGK